MRTTIKHRSGRTLELVSFFVEDSYDGVGMIEGNPTPTQLFIGWYELAKRHGGLPIYFVPPRPTSPIPPHLLARAPGLFPPDGAREECAAQWIEDQHERHLTPLIKRTGCVARLRCVPLDDGHIDSAAGASASRSELTAVWFCDDIAKRAIVDVVAEAVADVPWDEHAEDVSAIRGALFASGGCDAREFNA